MSILSERSCAVDATVIWDGRMVDFMAGAYARLLGGIAWNAFVTHVIHGGVSDSGTRSLISVLAGMPESSYQKSNSIPCGNLVGDF